MKKLVIFLFSLLIATFIYAAKVPKEYAQKVALNHYYQCVKSLGVEIKQTDLQINCIQEVSLDNDACYYVFNINNDEGFVIVSADDNIKPIWAYSLQSAFNIWNISPSQQS